MTVWWNILSESSVLLWRLRQTYKNISIKLFKRHKYSRKLSIKYGGERNRQRSESVSEAYWRRRASVMAKMPTSYSAENGESINPAVFISLNLNCASKNFSKATGGTASGEFVCEEAIVVQAKRHKESWLLASAACVHNRQSSLSSPALRFALMSTQQSNHLRVVTAGMTNINWQNYYRH